MDPGLLILPFLRIRGRKTPAERKYLKEQGDLRREKRKARKQARKSQR